MARTKSELPMIHVRIPKSLLKRVDLLRVEWDLETRGQALERILELGLPVIEARAAGNG